MTSKFWDDFFSRDVLKMAKTFSENLEEPSALASSDLHEDHHC